MSLQGLYDLYHVLASQITIEEKFRNNATPVEEFRSIYEKSLYGKFNIVVQEINSRIDYKKSEK